VEVSVEQKIKDIKVPAKLHWKLKKAAADWQGKIGEIACWVTYIGLYIIENLGWAETKKIVRHYYSLACLNAARNDLSHMGFNVSKPRTFNELIRDAEEFLEKKSSGGEKK